MSESRTVERGSWVRFRDGAVMRVDFLPGDDWPGWYNPVPETLVGGLMHEGTAGWYVSIQAARIDRIIGVYANKDDAYGRPKAVPVTIKR